MAVAMIQAAGKVVLNKARILGHVDNGMASFQTILAFIPEVDHPDAILIIEAEEHHTVSKIFVKPGIPGTNGYLYHFRELTQFTKTFDRRTDDIKRSIHRVAIRIGQIIKGSNIDVTIVISTRGRLVTPNLIMFDLPVHLQCGSTPVTLDIQVKNNQQINTVTVPTLKTHFTDSRIRCCDEPLSQQFSMIVETCEPIAPSAITAVIRGKRYFALCLRPAHIQLQSAPLESELLIILDNSFSMSGSSLQYAKRALTSLIKKFPATCFFNVIIFNSTYFSFFDSSVPCSAEYIATAETRLSEIDATGGTNLLDPMTYVYNQPPRQGCVRQIFLLTDGQVESRSEILELVARHRSDHRIMCFGIGRGCDVAFFDTIARDSGGRPEFINGNNIEESVDEQWEYCSKSLTETGVNVRVVLAGVTEFEIAPNPIPSLFANSVTPVFLRISDICSRPFHFEITGQTGAQDFRYEIVVRPVETFVHLDQLFGSLWIKDLERELKDAERNCLGTIRSQIVGESIEMGITSPFTTRCAVVATAIPRIAKPDPQMPNAELDPIEIMDFDEIAPASGSAVPACVLEAQPLTEAQIASGDRIREVITSRVAPAALDKFIPQPQIITPPWIPRTDVCLRTVESRRPLPPPPPAAVAVAPPPMIMPVLRPVTPISRPKPAPVITAPQAVAQSLKSLISPTDESKNDTLWTPAGLARIAGIEKGDRITYLFGDTGGDAKYAVKVFIPNAKLDKCHSLILHEVFTVEKLNHPCILRIRAACDVEAGKGPCICVDFMPQGSLEAQLKTKCAELKDRTRQVKIVVGCALACEYLHKNGRIHGGLRPSNIFVDGDGNPKVADFLDFTLCQKRLISPVFEKATGMSYAAPERSDTRFTNKIDVFSWALIAILVFTNSESSVRMSAGASRLNRTIDGFDTRIVKLIEQCLSKEANQRPTFTGIREAFEAIDYKIFADVNSGIIRDFATASTA
jgi:serine/threonine protein kinase